MRGEQWEDITEAGNISDEDLPGQRELPYQTERRTDHCQTDLVSQRLVRTSAAALVPLGRVLGLGVLLLAGQQLGGGSHVAGSWR